MLLPAWFITMFVVDAHSTMFVLFGMWRHGASITEISDKLATDAQIVKPVGFMLWCRIAGLIGKIPWCIDRTITVEMFVTGKLTFPNVLSIVSYILSDLLARLLSNNFVTKVTELLYSTIGSCIRRGRGP